MYGTILQSFKTVCNLTSGCIAKIGFMQRILPPIENFYSTLPEQSFFAVEYERTKRISNRFDYETMRNYYCLYLKVDTTLLSDVFENFMAVFKNSYGFNVCHDRTAPEFC